MILGAEPSTTYAILAGVEVYEGGGEWELNGPAMNAMRLAMWLIDMQVPAENIKLFANFSTAPALQTPQGESTRTALITALAQRGVFPRRPDRPALELALDPAQLPGAGIAGCTLIVYISGHGLHAIGDNGRYALMADASKFSCHAIRIDNQADSLRLNPAAARFSTQLFIHDACAQTVSATLQPKALGCPLPLTEQRTRQYCLFAARPGEFALTDAARGGAFTDRLLAALAAADTLRGLDVEALYRTLEDHFRTLKQHPALYRRNEYSMPSSLAAGMSRSDGRAVDALAEALRSVPIAPALMRAAFSDVARDRAPAWVAARGAGEKQWEGVHDIIADLDARLLDQGLTPVELFALQLASHCTRHASAGAPAYAMAAASLDAWIAAWPAQRAPGATQLEQARLGRLEAAAKNERVILLEPGAAADDSGFGIDMETGGRAARAWLYVGAEAPLVHWFEPVAGNLTERIAAMLGELAHEDWIVGTTIIELLLPLDLLFQHYSGIDVTLDRQRNIVVPLGSRKLVLALRSSERAVEEVWHTQWRAHWTAGEDSRKGLAKTAARGWRPCP